GLTVWIDKLAFILADIATPGRLLAWWILSTAGHANESSKHKVIVSPAPGRIQKLFGLLGIKQSGALQLANGFPRSRGRLTKGDEIGFKFLSGSRRRKAFFFFALCVKGAPYSHLDTSGLPEELDPHAGTQLPRKPLDLPSSSDLAATGTESRMETSLPYETYCAGSDCPCLPSA